MWRAALLPRIRSRQTEVPMGLREFLAQGRNEEATSEAILIVNPVIAGGVNVYAMYKERHFSEKFFKTKS